MSNLAGISPLHVRYRRAYAMKVIRCHDQLTEQGSAKARHDFTFFASPWPVATDSIKCLRLLHF
jgi:hypothetical protein